MAEGDPLPPDNWAARYCKPSQVVDGEVLGPAFQLEGTHEEVSMIWLERTGHANLIEQLATGRDALKASGFMPKSAGWFARIRVGAITGVTSVGNDDLALQVLHAPEPGNDCHCAIYGLPAKETDLSKAAGLALAGLVNLPPVQVSALP